MEASKKFCTTLLLVLLSFSSSFSTSSFFFWHFGNAIIAHGHGEGDSKISKLKIYLNYEEHTWCQEPCYVLYIYQTNLQVNIIIPILQMKKSDVREQP